MGFSQPSAGGDQFDAKDYNGRLLIVYPKSFSAETPTAHGISPSADCDIVVVDVIDPATQMPKYFQNARLFGNLAKSVSRDLGGQVLGRLGQVPTQRGNPAWVLQNYTDQDAAAATPADNAYQAGQFRATETPFQQPQAQQQAPAQAPAQQWPGAAAGPSPATTPPPPAPAATWPGQAQAAPAAPPAAAPQGTWPAQQSPAPAPTPDVAYTNTWPQQPPAAPAGGVDPAVLQALAAVGINPPPGTSAADIMAVYATIPK